MPLGLRGDEALMRPVAIWTGPGELPITRRLDRSGVPERAGYGKPR